MSSAIDPTKPASGSATTSSVRDNFTASKTEILELQRMAEDVVVTTGTIDAQAANFTNQDVVLAEGVRISIEIGALTGVANDVTIHTAGSSYVVGDTLNQSGSTSGGSGSGFTCTVKKVNSGGIVAVDITNTGSGYVTGEVITLGNVSVSGSPSGGKVTVTASNSSTTPTLNADGTGTKTIIRQDGSAISLGDFKAGQYCDLIYDATATKWVCLNSNSQFSRLTSPTIAGGSLSGNISGSPDFTGSPTAVTQTATDNTTKLATTAFVQSNSPITVACTYRLNGDADSATSFDPLGSGGTNGTFVEPNDGTAGKIGTVVTNTNGIFSFASTGVYLITLDVAINFVGSDQAFAKLMETSDNFSSESIASIIAFQPTTSQIVQGSCTYLFDSSQANDKVKIIVDNITNTNSAIMGNANLNETSITFIRLGNTAG